MRQDRLERYEPATWRAVVFPVRAGEMAWGQSEDDTWCLRHAWIGPCCCCVGLMQRMYESLLRTGGGDSRLSARYYLWRPLHGLGWEMSEWV